MIWIGYDPDPALIPRPQDAPGEHAPNADTRLYDALRKAKQPAPPSTPEPIQRCVRCLSNGGGLLVTLDLRTFLCLLCLRREAATYV